MRLVIIVSSMHNSIYCAFCALLHSLLPTSLLEIAHGQSAEALNAIWRTFYFIGGIFIAMVLTYRALCLQEGEGHQRLVSKIAVMVAKFCAYDVAGVAITRGGRKETIEVVHGHLLFRDDAWSEEGVFRFKLC